MDFPLEETASRFQYGTTYHWDDATPETGWIDPPTWNQPVFQATHDFVLPVTESSTTPPWGLYQTSLQAISNNAESRNVLAILWRNTPNDDHRGQTGTDLGTHTHTYALRVPSGLDSPATPCR